MKSFVRLVSFGFCPIVCVLNTNAMDHETCIRKIILPFLFCKLRLIFIFNSTIFHACLVQVFEVLDKKVSEETQCPGLAASDCVQQG